MNQLNLFIDPAWPEKRTDAVWYLCDQAGRVLQHGRSEPRHWPGVRGATEAGPAAGNEAAPAALPVNLILTGSQVACHLVRLPRGAAGRRPEVLAAALEDRLLADPGDCLLLPGAPDDDGLTPVAVLDRARLHGIVALLRELGLELRSAWADGHLLPERDGQRAGRLDAGLLVVPLGKAGFAAIDTVAEGPLGTPFAAILPSALPVSLAPGSDPAALAGGLRAEPETPDRFPLAAPLQGGFLMGEFAPPAARLPGLRPFLPAMRLAAGLLAVVIALVLAEWGWLFVQTRQLRRAEAVVFHDLFPRTALVDPVLQMRRQLDEGRRRAGLLGADDLLAQLETLARNRSLRWHRFNYEAGRLEAELSLPDAALAGLEADLQAAGYRPELRGRRPQAGGEVQIDLVLGGGGR